MALLKDFINLVFYGNFWIALAAMAMVLQSQWLFETPPYSTALSGLLFFATLFLYALHRIVGISRLKDFLEEERYAVIYRYRHHIRVYAFIGFAGAVYCFWYIPWPIRLELLVPGILSLAYVWPIFSGQRRLRDINHLKIFLIAIVWAWVTVRLPFVEAGQATFTLAQAMMVLERALFIFAITLPFDIRDLVVDQYSKVKTIPSMLGIKRSLYLAYASLGLACLLSLGQVHYTMAYHWGLIISYISTAFLIRFSQAEQHDYYYTGLVDGTMIFQLLWILLMQFFIS